MRKFIIMIAAVLLMLTVITPVCAENSTAAPSAEAKTASDAAFDEAYAFLTETGIAEKEDSPALGDNVTRAQLAEILQRAMGLSGDMAVSKDADSYLGYTNSDTFESEWQWISEKEQAESGAQLKHATPFYDVTSENDSWTAINSVALAGLMSGDGSGYFRPDIYASCEEVIKIGIKMLGCEFLTDMAYPEGYIAAAASEGILRSFKSGDYSSLVTKRDLYVFLYNTLKTEVYETYYFSADENKMHKSSGRMLMTAALGIYKTKGVVYANDKTYLDKNKKAGNNRIVINSTAYICRGYDADVLLGNKVTAYYKDKTDSDEPETVYIKVETPETRVIPAEDIESYGNYTYTVTGKNDKTETEKLLPSADVIYNGRALLDYTDENLFPKNGSVTLIDNDGDGAWDVAKVESLSTMIVSGADAYGEIIYGAAGDFKILNVAHSDYTVIDAGGGKTKLSNIRAKDILSVKQTLDVQGDKYTEIRIVTNYATGRLTAVSDGEYTVDGNVYKAADTFAGSPKIGTYGDFYLDAENKIIYFTEKTPLTIGYGYVAKAYSDDFDGKHQLRLFKTDGSFENFDLAKSVCLNNVSTSASKTMSSFFISGGKTVNRLIQYETNAGGEINYIVIAGALENGFCKRDITGSFSYRVTGCFLDGEKAVFWNDDDTVYMKIPQDKTKEEDYTIIDSFINDKYYSFGEIYAGNEKSIVADVFIDYVEGVDKNVLKNDGTYPAMVESVVPFMSKDGTAGYRLCVCECTERKTYESTDVRFFDILKDLERGDIVRAEKTGSEISALIKIYDVGSRSMTGGDAKVGGVTVLNACSVIHGIADSRAFEDGYFNVALREYKNGVPEGKTSKIYTCKTAEYVFLIYDTSEKKPPLVGSVNDVVFASDFRDGDEVLVHHSWATGRTVFVIK